VDGKTSCETDEQQLRALVREARHFAQYMANPMASTKNKAKATAWLKRVDKLLELRPRVCPRGHANDPDARRCLAYGGLTEPFWICSHWFPALPETTTSHD
jgi:hypothetical protein